MNIAAADFFRPLKLTSPPTNSDYQMVDCYLQAADAFARTIRQSVFIIDFHQKGFLYVSDDPLFLCGEKSRNVRKMGFDFYKKQVPASDLWMIQQINEASYDFYIKQSPDVRLNNTLSFDYHLKQPTGRLVLVNQKVTPLVLDRYNNIWLALCLVTHSPNKGAGNICITQKGNNKTFVLDLSAKEWVTYKRVKLTGQELSIITLATRGFKIDQIALELHISEATVKFHKGNIFKKLQVKNMAEAISSAINMNLI
ncbi:MAG: helix-turn-helix transcriptional regulator [Bacteroidetes bacterium]|nr:helix-turn-helix transcriptional regulator [Bacteroidota bacterium]